MILTPPHPGLILPRPREIWSPARAAYERWKRRHRMLLEAMGLVRRMPYTGCGCEGGGDTAPCIDCGAGFNQNDATVSGSLGAVNCLGPFFAAPCFVDGVFPWDPTAIDRFVDFGDTCQWTWRLIVSFPGGACQGVVFLSYRKADGKWAPSVTSGGSAGYQFEPDPFVGANTFECVAGIISGTATIPGKSAGACAGGSVTLVI